MMGKLAVTEVELLLDCLAMQVREQLTFQCGFEFWEKLEHPLEGQLLDQFGNHIQNAIGHKLGLDTSITPNMASP